MPSFGPRDSLRTELQGVLPQRIPEFLLRQRWFGGKARKISSADVVDVVPMLPDPETHLVLAQVNYATGPSETYSLPLLHAGAEFLPKVELPATVIEASPDAVLRDALANEHFLGFLLESIEHERSFHGQYGEVVTHAVTALQSLINSTRDALQPSLMKVEQSNSSIIYGRHLVLKFFRKLDVGINPDLEIGTFLAQQGGFHNVPSLAGHLEYRSGADKQMILGILQEFVPNQGDAWQFTLKHVAGYYERAKSLASPPPLSRLLLIDRARATTPAEVRDQIGQYLDAAELLGRRTGELHLALSSSSGDPAFAPQPFTPVDRQRMCSSALSLWERTVQLLRDRLHTLPEDLQQQAYQVLSQDRKLQQRYRLLLRAETSGLRIRIHGDYHLGQVLFTGNDFIIVDFEGEPARLLSERRAKQSPLQDVAGMLRSFHYAAYAPFLTSTGSETGFRERNWFAAWAHYWQAWVSATFLGAYLRTMGSSPCIPQDHAQLAELLDAYILDKAVYELGYELNNRPSWVAVPLQGIAALLSESR
jgi:maltose alpha-D-glucosyltransferase/alpha-amylase